MTKLAFLLLVILPSAGHVLTFWRNVELKPVDVSPVLSKDGRLGDAARLWLPEHMMKDQFMWRQNHTLKGE